MASPNFFFETTTYAVSKNFMVWWRCCFLDVFLLNTDQLFLYHLVDFVPVLQWDYCYVFGESSTTFLLQKDWRKPTSYEYCLRRSHIHLLFLKEEVASHAPPIFETRRSRRRRRRSMFTCSSPRAWSKWARQCWPASWLRHSSAPSRVPFRRKRFR